MSTYLDLKLVGALLFGCMAATAALTPAAMRFAHRVGAVDRGGYRKVYRGDIPLLGGLGIAVPLLLLCFVTSVAGYLVIRNWQWVFLHYKPLFDPLFSMAGARYDSAILLAGGIAIVVLGVVDDIKNLRARWKLLGQILIAIFVCLSGYTIQTVSVPFLGMFDLGAGFGGFLTMVWVVGLINAFNLIDGIDGLASGIALIGAVALVILGIIQENGYVMFASAALAGSLLAFLPYNFPPARVFLGDTGSMFLGYSLAMMSLVGAQKSEAAVIILAPMLALGLPIFETLISIARRYAGGMPVFVGDNRHTHHRLLLKGYSQRRVVLTLYGAGLLLAAASIMAASISEESPWSWCSYALYLGTLAYIAWLAGYLRPTTLRKVLERRQRNKSFQALARYAALRFNAGGDTALLLDLCRNELGLRRVQVGTREEGSLMASSDVSAQDEAREFPEELLVKSADGLDILIRYEFGQAPDAERRQDVSSCLARIFDGTTAVPFRNGQD